MTQYSESSTLCNRSCISNTIMGVSDHDDKGQHFSYTMTPVSNNINVGILFLKVTHKSLKTLKVINQVLFIQSFIHSKLSIQTPKSDFHSCE